MAAATAVGVGITFFSRFGFLLIWAGFIGGGFIGESLLRVTGRKRGPKVEVIAAISSIAGIFIGMMAWRLLNGYSLDPSSIFQHLRFNPFYTLSLCIAVGAAVSRIRYM
ncbi:MAG: hypothetical protein ABJA67_05995 [Chthonomonadales bacterium]